MHLRLYLSYTCGCLIDEIINAQFVQNDSSNGGPDAALEGAFDGGLNVALEETPYKSN